MSKFTRVKIAGVFALTIALAASFVGCGNSGSGVGDTSGGVAATVDGDPIGEKTITEYIQNFRESSDLLDDEAWAQWMANNNYTPESVREEVINYYVEQLLYERAAEEFGVEVTDEEVETALSDVKASFDSEDSWNDALSASGFTEETYINDVIRPDLLQEKLADAVSTGTTGDVNDNVLATLQDNADFINGAKRSSHILFATEDRETAEEVLQQLKDGDIDWETAVAEYSIDEGSAIQGGDVGWDVLTTFVDEYQNALNNLDNGEMSDLVESQFGYHIIRVTDEYTVPEGGITTTDDVPAEILSYVVDNETATSDSNAFYTWYADYEAAATVVINPMPSGLPYDVDMSGYGAEEEDQGTIYEEVEVGEEVTAETPEDTGDEAENADNANADADAAADAADAENTDDLAGADEAADAENENANEAA